MIQAGLNVQNIRIPDTFSPTRSYSRSAPSSPELNEIIKIELCLEKLIFYLVIFEFDEI